MIPILYESTEAAFTSNGLGRLRDCISCVVTEERNGLYEVDFEYPLDGVNYDLIQVGRIIGVTHNDGGDIQPFDIVSYSKPIDGVVTFHCTHISYRQSYMTAVGGPIYSLVDAFKLLKKAQPSNPFTYRTDKVSEGLLGCADGMPHTVRAMLGGMDGSILDAYGGEYEWDKFNVILHSARGQDRNFSIRYGVNMLDYNEDYDTQGTYSSCIPFWTDGNDSVVGDKQNSGGTTITGRGECVPLDVSQKFQEKPTKAQVEAAGLAMMASSNPYLPAQTINVKFARLQDLGYEEIGSLFECELCDTLNVIFPDYNSSGRFKIVKTVWDALADRYESMELGSLATSLAEALGINATEQHGATLAPLGNDVGIHKVEPEWISDNPFVPGSHLTNGFTADENYFYLAHHIQDSDPLTITAVNKTTLVATDHVMSFDGHGNTLSHYNGYLYVTDSSDGWVDVVRTSDFTKVGEFKLDPQINGFSIAEINERLITASTEGNNNVLLTGFISNGINQIMNRVAMEDSANSWTQGIDHTFNCIYVSRSYGQVIGTLQNLPTITAYAWSGKVLNTLYLNLKNITGTKDIELEDIWRDSENDRIYFTTASGRIGYVDTAGFTTAQTHHTANNSTLRNSEYLPMLLHANTSGEITYRQGTQLATSIKVNPFTNQNQGEYLGVGLVAGVNAIYALRAGGVFGYTIPVSSSKNILCAAVEYLYSNGVLTYSNGSVYILNNDGTVTKQSLTDFSDANTTNRTVINSLIHTPYSIPYFSTLAEIPLPS